MIYLSQGSNKKIVFGSFPTWVQFVSSSSLNSLKLQSSGSTAVPTRRKRKEGLKAVFYTAAAPWFNLFSSYR